MKIFPKDLEDDQDTEESELKQDQFDLSEEISVRVLYWYSFFFFLPSHFSVPIDDDLVWCSYETAVEVCHSN